MQELKEIRFNDNRIFLSGNHVRTPILPQIASELDRDIVVQGECVMDGAVFARNFEIQQGPCRTRGPVFTHSELHVNSDARGPLFFEKAVASSNAVVSLAPACRLHFLSDITAKSVRLRNAYISGSVFADDIVFEDCIVIGGVFGSNTVELNNCIVGTFNAPVVRASRAVYLLLPSAFSVEMISVIPGTQMFNLALADLGALMRGADPLHDTGSIAMSLSTEDVKAVLIGDGTQQIVRTYSIAGKVLAADLVDYDRLQNHFLLSCASLGNQLLRTYDLGPGQDGSPVTLTPERIADFFFSILDGTVTIPEISGEFDIASIVRGEPAAVQPKQSVAPQAESASDTGSDAPTESAPAPAEAVADSFESPAQDSAGIQDAHSSLNPPQAQSETAQSAAASEQTAESTDHCTHCGDPLDADAAFCGSCGEPRVDRNPQGPVSRS